MQNLEDNLFKTKEMESLLKEYVDKVMETWRNMDGKEQTEFFESCVPAAVTLLQLKKGENRDEDCKVYGMLFQNLLTKVSEAPAYLPEEIAEHSMRRIFEQYLIDFHPEILKDNIKTELLDDLGNDYLEQNRPDKVYFSDEAGEKLCDNLEAALVGLLYNGKMRTIHGVPADRYFQKMEECFPEEYKQAVEWVEQSHGINPEDQFDKDAAKLNNALGGCKKWLDFYEEISCCTHHSYSAAVSFVKDYQYAEHIQSSYSFAREFENEKLDRRLRMEYSILSMNTVNTEERYESVEYQITNCDSNYGLLQMVGKIANIAVLDMYGKDFGAYLYQQFIEPKLLERNEKSEFEEEEERILA